MKRILEVMLLSLVAGGVVVLSFGCSSEPNEEAENQVVTVPRGNLSVDITAVGNLALSRIEELAFDLFYPTGTVGTVEEVLVDEGDIVREGQVLAKVDASEWEEQLSALEDKVTAAERQLTAKKRALLQVELNLMDAKDALEEAEIKHVWPDEIYTARQAVRSAESEVEEAKAVLGGGLIKEAYNSRTQTVTVTIEEARTSWEIKNWSDKLAAAEEKLKAARVTLDDLLSESYAETKVSLAETKLRAARVKLDSLIAKSATEDELAVQRMNIEVAQEQLDDAQKARAGVARKRLQVQQAEGNVEDAQQAIKDAEKALKDAQETLNAARNKSPLITAPFDGFVTKVNVAGGDEIKTGTVAVVIADPTKFEAEVMVSEMDILQIVEGGEASVKPDAMPGLTLPAKITHISPTAVIQSGVVNYKVTVEVQSFEETMRERQETGQQWRQASANLTTDNISPTVFPERSRPAFGSSNLTQEQISQMRQQRQRTRAGQSGEQQRQVPTVMPPDFQLREGLTVTVSIIVDEATDVLLVPNSAVTTRRGETTVKVLKDGVTEERAIKAGISNFQFTEVVEGLSEGEQIIAPQGAATTTQTTQQQGQRQGDVQSQMRRMLR